MTANSRTIAIVDEGKNELLLTIEGRQDVVQRSYADLLESTSNSLRRLLQEEAAAKAAGEVLSLSTMAAKERAQSILVATRNGLARVTSLADRTLERTVDGEIIPLAVEYDQRAIASQLPEQYRDFGTRVSPAVLDAAVETSAARRNGVLYQVGITQGDAIEQTLLEGIVVGQNPRQAATRLTAQAIGELNLAGVNALQFMRTHMMDAYRTGDSAVRFSNSDIVRGWQWYSAGDERTCASCWAMHGFEFPNSQPGPNDHPNGRCVAIPIVTDAASLGLPPPPTRDELWDRLSDEQKRRVLGPTRFRMLQAGEIGLTDLSKVASSTGRKFRQATTVRELEAKVQQRQAEAASRRAIEEGRAQIGPNLNLPTATSVEQAVEINDYMSDFMYRELTVEQSRVIDQWISAEGFTSANGLLRGDSPMLQQLAAQLDHIATVEGRDPREYIADILAGNVNNAQASYVVRLIEELDAIIEAHPIDGFRLGGQIEGGDEGIVTYRSVVGDPAMRRWQVGDTITDDGFMATTLNREFAEEWGLLYQETILDVGAGLPDEAFIADEFGESVLDYDRRLPTQVWEIEVPGDGKGIFIGQSAVESELLLPRGTTLEVVSVDNAGRPRFRVIYNDVEPFSARRTLADEMTSRVSGIRTTRERILATGVDANERVTEAADRLATGRSTAVQNGVTVTRVDTPEKRAAAVGQLDGLVSEMQASGEDYDLTGPEFTRNALTELEGETRVARTDFGEIAGAVVFEPYLGAAISGPGAGDEGVFYVGWLGSTELTERVGSELMAEVIIEAAETGRGLMLTPTPAARPFYNKIGLREDPYGDGSVMYGLTADETGNLARAIQERTPANPFFG